MSVKIYKNRKHVQKSSWVIHICFLFFYFICNSFRSRFDYLTKEVTLYLKNYYLPGSCITNLTNLCLARLRCSIPIKHFYNPCCHPWRSVGTGKNPVWKTGSPENPMVREPSCLRCIPSPNSLLQLSLWCPPVPRVFQNHQRIAFPGSI